MLRETMQLQQGQIWKKGEDYFCIVAWARLAIEYKAMKDPSSGEGVLHQVTKKEFCRLLNSTLLSHAAADLTAWRRYAASIESCRFRCRRSILRRTASSVASARGR